MNYTQEQYQDAVLFIATKFDRFDDYREAITESYERAAEMVAFEIFARDYRHYFEMDDKLYEAVSIVRCFATELLKTGTVKFLNPTP